MYVWGVVGGEIVDPFFLHTHLSPNITALFLIQEKKGNIDTTERASIPEHIIPLSLSPALPPPPPPHHPLRSACERRSSAMLSTLSPGGAPSVAGGAGEESVCGNRLGCSPRRVVSPNCWGYLSMWVGRPFPPPPFPPPPPLNGHSGGAQFIFSPLVELARPLGEREERRQSLMVVVMVVG